MTRTLLFPALLTLLLLLHACEARIPGEQSQSLSNSMDMTVNTDTLKEILNAFNRHDLDAIMEYFAEDCSFDFPRGPDPWGKRFFGKEEVRKALASRFSTLPDVHYGDDRHWVAADGSRGVSEWLLTGTTPTGIRVEVRGCDLWEFKDGNVVRKDSYWKIVE
jgi:ketosteroid isomerase-like protein